jgi:hypothetical protein
MATSKRVGRIAAKLLRTGKTKAVRAVAGAALRQDIHKKPKAKKK